MDIPPGRSRAEPHQSGQLSRRTYCNTGGLPECSYPWSLRRDCIQSPSLLNPWRWKIASTLVSSIAAYSSSRVGPGIGTT